MKLLRVGETGAEKPAILDKDGNIRDLSSHIYDIENDALSAASLAKINALNLNDLPIIDSDSRIGACVGNVGKIICVGLNFADHAAETGADIPSEPVLFFKSTTSICGPNDEILIPRGSEKTDWEVELAVIIGKKATYVDEADAMDHVAGYAVMNDLSERAFQLERGTQWSKGKSADTFGPLGPWMVTKDEITDPQNLNMWLDVDEHRYQQGTTKTMVFGVAHLIHYISQFMTLMPGDVISTGTPPGVGLGQKPPIYLRVGQKMSLGIEGLGEQHQLVGKA
ncbi:MAG: fumarylacetoacetate hydrolase family protein [OCS116 cluster bacterium]|nr:fumarylacetoacetate hydrolase family protein [OCS116 cluster bacterium]